MQENHEAEIERVKLSVKKDSNVNNEVINENKKLS